MQWCFNPQLLRSLSLLKVIAQSMLDYILLGGSALELLLVVLTQIMNQF